MATAYTLSLLTNESWQCTSCAYLNKSSSYPTCEMCEVNDEINKNLSLSLERICMLCSCSNVTTEKQCSLCANSSNYLFSNKTNVNFRIDPNTTEGRIPLVKRLNSLEVPLHTASEQQKSDEIDAEQKFIQIFQYCQKNGINFVDDQFLPSIKSIGIEHRSVTQWLRIHDVKHREKHKKKSWSVMSDPQPTDVEQGNLGDCWLMAALTLITERPQMLAHILLTSTINQQGIYIVRLCHNGLWKTVIVDDYFPCTKSKRLAFTKARRQQLFAPLIEKACAKLHGSYCMLRGGSTKDGLQLLTGAPSDHLRLQITDIEDNDTRDMMWTKLVSACEANLLIGAATGRTDITKDEYRKARLSSNHAYSLQMVHAISQNERFVLLRNPRAQSKYVDPSMSTQTSEYLQKLKVTNPSNGYFWMSWRTFLKFFYTLNICSYRDDLYDIRLEGEFTPHAAHSMQAYYFYLNQPSTIIIGLFHQRSDRKRLYTHHTQSLILCDVQNDGTHIGRQYAKIWSAHKGYTHWSGILQSGTYVLIPFSASYWYRDATIDHEMKFTLVLHSFTKLNLVIVEESSRFLSNCLIIAIRSNSTSMNKHSNYCLYKLKRRGELFAIVAENKTTGRMLNVDVLFEESSEVRSRNSRNSFVIFDSIPPNHCQLLFLAEDISNRKDKISQVTNSFKYSLKYILSSKSRRPSKPPIDSMNDVHTIRPIV